MNSGRKDRLKHFAWHANVVSLVQRHVTLLQDQLFYLRHTPTLTISILLVLVWRHEHQVTTLYSFIFYSYIKAWIMSREKMISCLNTAYCIYKSIGMDSVTFMPSWKTLTWPPLMRNGLQQRKAAGGLPYRLRFYNIQLKNKTLRTK